MALNPAFLAFIPIMAVVARRKRILRKFREAGADGPERARTFAELELQEGTMTSRMVRSGVLVTTEGGRHYVSADGVEQWRKRAVAYSITALALVAVSLTCLSLFLRSR